MKKEIKIAVVEDNVYLNKVLTKYLQGICTPSNYPGFQFQWHSYLNAHDCIETMETDLDIMILDYVLMNDEEDDILTATDVLKELQHLNESCKVIVFSGQTSPYITAQLMKSGVYEYVDKNTNGNDRLGAVVQQLIKRIAA